MKLNELYHKLEDKTFAEYLETLLKSNVAKISSGRFATVVIPKDKKYVYKVWVEDKPFEKWVDFCRKNENNPNFGSLLPRYIKKTVVMNIPFSRNTRFEDTQMKIQRIEKLLPSDNYNNIGGLEYGPHIFDTYEEIIEHIYHNLKSMPSEITTEMLEDSDMDDLEGFAKLMTQLKSLFTKIGKGFGTFDGHAGNFMFRPNGELVLTDIFCDTKSIQSIGEISWDGSEFPQSKSPFNPGTMSDDDEDEADPIAIFPPSKDDDYYDPKEFIKGRKSNKKDSHGYPIIDWTKQSQPPEVLNWLRNHDIADLMSHQEFIDNLYGDPKMIIALSAKIQAYDYMMFIGLLCGVLGEIPKSEISKYEDDIINHIIDNELEDSVEQYVDTYGNWPKMFKAAEEAGWDISHLEP